MWCHKPVEVSRTKMVASRVKVVSVVNATVCSSADTQKVQNTMEVMNASGSSFWRCFASFGNRKKDMKR